MKLTLISGLSGSGKSVALAALEDSGFFCVDNLPPALMPAFLAWAQSQNNNENIAVSIDTRSHELCDGDMTLFLANARQTCPNLRILFLEAADDVLIRRFNETRRRHPLVNNELALPEALIKERLLLCQLREAAFCIDTSFLSSQALRQRMVEWLQLPINAPIITFESFGFKYGVPLNADYVFDVRSLPNPFYEPSLRDKTGLDDTVVAFFQKDPQSAAMIDDIAAFLKRQLQKIPISSRNYLSIAIGCTGGKHRSVYVASQLAQHFVATHSVLLRHRQLPQNIME